MKTTRCTRRRELVERVTITGPNAALGRELARIPSGWRLAYLNPQVRGGRVLERFRLVLERVVTGEGSRP